MLIQKQFRVAFAIVAAAVLGALTLLLLMNARVEKIERLRFWSNQVVKHVFDCNILGSESILQDNARSREQYATASTALQALIDSPPNDELAHRYLPGIAAGKTHLDHLLGESSRSGVDAPLERENYELHAMLVSQWMLQTRSLLQSARDLRLTAAGESSRARRLAVWAGSASIVLVGLITGLMFFRLNKTLVKPLHELSAGARRIGEGDLAVRLIADPRNEIGMVAESFNVMTGRLAARQAEVQEKLRDLEAFSYSVAHDLKAPLRSIVGYGNLLATEHADRLGEEAKSFLLSMRSSGLQMSGLIDDLLQFGQLTHRHIEIHPVSLQPLCLQLLSEMKDEIAEHRATVSYTGDSAMVLGNELLLKQVLRNLVSNAIKFVPKGTSPAVQITGGQNGLLTRVEVKDNGIGIALEHQQKIFGLFERLHSRQEFAGTGVGLALVQKAVQRLHGEVGVTSAAGQGSTFWFKLPQPSSGDRG